MWRVYLYRRLSLVGLCAGRPQDAAGRASLTLIAKPHASLLGLLHHHQPGLVQNPLQHLGVASPVLRGNAAGAPRGQQTRGASTTARGTGCRGGCSGRMSHLSGGARRLRGPREGAGWLWWKKNNTTLITTLFNLYLPLPGETSFATETWPRRQQKNDAD